MQGIAIRGARVHNLKDVDCDLPRNSLVVITGPSGSGKSSLAFDTLYAEGQRRYAESLSAYARQFLDQVEKPDVDLVTGLSPAIAIEQRTTSSHPRSTVGTVTEVYDHLRLLFSGLGRPHCPRCGEPVAARTPTEIADAILETAGEAPVSVLAPVARGRKGAFRKELAALRDAGYHRARVDGDAFDLDDAPPLDPRRNHRIEVLVDRLAARPAARRRLIASVERASDLAAGVVLVAVGGGERLFSRNRSCARCDVAVTDLGPRAFSFNSAYGACPACQGLGWRWRVDPDKVIPDPHRPLGDGAIQPWAVHGLGPVRDALEDVAARHGFTLDQPLSALPRRGRRALLQGDAGFAGILPHLMGRAEKALSLADAEAGDRDAFEALRPYLTETACADCGGARLRPESLAVRVGGRSIAEYARLTIAEASPALRALAFGERERPLADRILPGVLERLAFLERVGVGYLTLDRATPSLSAGEAHRVRLAAQIGARLQGIVYVLDEPSVGLHQRDNERLLGTLTAIRDLGNTVVVVEHDAETIRAADYVIDLGEGAGRHGGRLMYQGPPATLNGSLTGRYLRGEIAVPMPAARRAGSGHLRVRGAREHNLRGIDVAIPLGTLTVVSGVSGSGKSTLVEDILFRALSRHLGRKTAAAGRHDGLEGAEAVEDVVAIDQRPIGRTPRSNPATYTGALAAIRELFSLVPEARARGYRSGRFSFNVKGGRCEACQGDGARPLRMHFLPDAHVRCEACRGRRYNRETLEVLYRGRTIADVLDLTVDEAEGVLGTHPRLRRVLATLREVGLGYLRLGQSALTLSGGEAQRVKLARELGRRDTGRTVYILDEPTTGLHVDDVARLLAVLGRLVDAGNTVVAVEHNLDVIRAADHVIDLGPDAAEDGGRVVACGTPEQVARSRKSHTARYLRAALAAAGKASGKPGTRAPDAEGAA